MFSKARIYLTADGRAVADGSKEARTLLVIKGGEITDAELAKYDGASYLAKGIEPEPEPEPEPEHKRHGRGGR